MNLRRPGAWQRVVALAPLLLVLVSLPSQVLVRCQMDGLLRESCCCPNAHQDSPGGPTLSGAGCCKSVTSVRQLPVVRTAPSPEAAPAPVAVALPLAAPDPTPSFRHVRPAAPAREGPPLLLLKQAFLI